MHTEICLTTRFSGVRHAYTFIGDTEDETIFPAEMEQGGEHYHINWEDVPDEVAAELNELTGWEFIEE